MPPQINRHSLEHTVRFVHDLDRARNVEDIASKVLQLFEIEGGKGAAGAAPGGKK